MRKTRTALAVFLLLSSRMLAGGAGPGDTGVLHLYAPRAKTVIGSSMILGDLCVVRCDDAALRAKAAAVAMGRGPYAKETILIDRPTILSRLAAVGIYGKKVRFAGAKSICLTRNESVFGSDDILAAARRYLTEHSPESANRGYRLVRKIGELTVASPGKAKLSISPVSDSPQGYVKLEASAVVGKQKLGAVSILFRIIYPHRQAVTTELVRSGQAFTPRNTRLRTVYLERSEPKDWSAPYGMAATRNIPSGTVILTGMAQVRKLEIVVRRRQIVTMVVRRPGILVQSKGQALQDGRPGDYIKVRNTMSNSIVIAKVQYDGTVSPSTETP